MNEKIATSLQVTGFDPNTVDLAFLVGAFEQIKRWSESEPHLKALGRNSICEGMRMAGELLLGDKND